jgi:GH24 family phage-related lysozyme (muramidase)
MWMPRTVSALFCWFIVLSFSPSASSQSPITYGSTTSGAISAAAEVDSFAFEGSTGEIITIRLTGTWVAAPRLQLLAPGDSILKNLTGQVIRIDTFRLAATGSFKIRVSDDNAVDTGSYGLHVQRIVGPAGAAALAYGATVQDSVRQRTEIRAYTFPGTSGEIITAFLAGSWNTVPRLELYDPAGVLRRRVDGQTVRIDTLRLTATGTYTLFVMDNDGLQTGNYGLHLQSIGSPAGATGISYGQTLQDTLQSRSEITAYTFPGAAGEVMTALLAGNWATVPRLELYDPAGVLRKRIDAQSVRADTVRLTATGTYTLLVLDSDGQQTGNYGLHLQRIVNPVGSSVISYGQTLQDTLTARAEINSYTFDGGAGEVITAFLSGSWANVPRLELYDSTGALRKRFDAQAARADTVHLPSTGTYTLFVLDSDGQQTGNYGLHLQRITNPAGARAIGYGQTVQDTLKVRAEIDAFTFTGSAGEVITALLAGTWNPVPRLELYDPAGVLRKRLDGQSIRADTVRLPATGTYTILILDSDGQQTGNYGLHLQRIVAPVGATAIGYGQTLQDTLTVRAEINSYTFSGSAGEVITAFLAASWSNVPRLELYDPAGILRKRIDAQSIRADTVHLTANGSYTLLVLDSDGQQTGNYGLHLQRITIPAGAPLIGYGQTLQDTLSARADINVYTFSGTAGDVVSAFLAGNWSTVPRLELYDPAGVLRKRVDAQSIRFDTVQLTSTGMYALLVLDSDGQQTGNYGLTLQRLINPAGAPAISFGETRQDTLYSRAELNAYTFTGAAGEIVTVKASGSGVPGFLTMLEVYTPPGRILRRTAASNDVRVDTLRLPESGTYSILMLDADGQQTGTYGIHLQRIITPGGARSLSYGQTLQDTLYQRGEINAYTFSGAAGEVATLRTFATGLGFSQLELYHADGRLWKRQAGSNVLRLDTLHLPAGGTYTVLVMDDNGQETGNYGLHIQRITNPVGAAALTYGQTRQDTLYQRTQVSAYTFIGGLFDTVSIRMDATWPNGPQLELYRSDGQLLKRIGGTGTARIDTFKLSGNGVYTIFALDNDGQQTGSHTVTLTGRIATTTIVSSIVSAGWNMLSVPAVVTDFSRNGVYPGSIAGAYRYTPGVGYSLRDTLETGTGYWIKFGSARVIDIAGSTIPLDTLEVQAGWNMIGTITRPVPVGAIESIPPGIVIGSFFAYNGSYTAVDTLEPGRGFWAKMSLPGQLLLGTPGPGAIRAVPRDSTKAGRQQMKQLPPTK